VSKPLILIVEDQPNERWTLTAILENSGYSVLTASTAKAGLILFRSNHIDAVILDFVLPDDGATIGPEMKRLKPEVPIMVFSGYPEAENSRPFADALIAKPEHPDKVMQHLAALLKPNGANAA
jgi:two-component system response regulator RegA